ncbi:MAG: signal peptide peptidase SppA [Deltaproteobacteria bacterium]|nr:signal peptide peptidase SppA [Deltaproteobacteria bacterium]
MPQRRAVGRGLGILGAFLLVFAVLAWLLTFSGEGGGGSPWAAAVGVIEVTGVIEDDEEIVAAIRRFAKSDQIRAVVLRVESPGGAVTPSQEIYRELLRLREKKPLVASLGEVAASGGYYVASACTVIVANPGTITGSIGVIMGTMYNVHGLLEKLGIKGTVIKAGTYKDIGSSLRDITAEERQILKDMLDDVHRQFIAAIAVGRKMDEAAVRPLADGRVYSGEQAKRLGLVDRIGGFQDAVELAAKEAGISGEPRLVRAQMQKKSWWRQLTSRWLGEMSSNGATGMRMFFLGPRLS